MSESQKLEAVFTPNMAANISQLSTNLQKKILERPTLTFLNNTTSNIAMKFRSLQHVINKPVPLPVNFDGRVVWKDLLSEVQNQGTCGSCWAFASSSCLADRFNIQSQGRMHIQLSSSKLVLCDWHGKEFNSLLRDQQKAVSLDELGITELGCHGNTLLDSWRYLYVIGTPTEKCFPYTLRKNRDKPLNEYKADETLPICPQIAGVIGDMCIDWYYDVYTGREFGTPERFYRCLHYYFIPGTSEYGGSVENIMLELYQWGTVATGMDVYPDFYTFDAKNDIYEWNGKGPLVGGHAVVIVGWGEEKGKKYWIIRNSWGKDWGDGGYFKMVRGVNNCRIENNSIVGVPDFFYPIGYKEPQTYPWIKTSLPIKHRKQIDENLNNITGGGIDPTTGYTRRVMVMFPEYDFSPPINYKDLPDFMKFYAGKDSVPHIVKDIQAKINPKHKQDRICVILTIIILVLLVVLVVRLL